MLLGLTTVLLDLTQSLPALHQQFDLPAPFVLHTDCPHYWRFHLPGVGVNFTDVFESSWAPDHIAVVGDQVTLSLDSASGEPYLVQTNVYVNGTGDREQRHSVVRSNSRLSHLLFLLESSFYHVHSQFTFGPMCAYLAVNYLDRFLSAYDLPKEKAWMMQLLGVACLSIAAKMEETDVPLSVDLQGGDAKFGS